MRSTRWVRKGCRPLREVAFLGSHIGEALTLLATAVIFTVRLRRPTRSDGDVCRTGDAPRAENPASPRKERAAGVPSASHPNHGDCRWFSGGEGGVVFDGTYLVAERRPARLEKERLLGIVEENNCFVLKWAKES